MSWILDECNKHSKKAEPIMDRANQILNDYDELYRIMSSQGGAGTFSKLVTALRSSVKEYDRKRMWLEHYATCFDTTGYRISYSGSDPLRINAANEYNTRQMQHDHDESKKQTRAVVDADMALHDVERALKNVETFLSTKRLSAYYQKKEEEKRIAAEEAAKKEAQEAAEKKAEEKKANIGCGISLAITFVTFVALVVLFGKPSWWIIILSLAVGFIVFLVFPVKSSPKDSKTQENEQNLDK